MTNPLEPQIALPIAVLMALAAALIWYVLVRPMPQQRERGVIVGSEYLPAETVKRVVPRVLRGFEYVPQTQRYQLTDRWVYRIRLIDRGIEVQCAVPAGDETYSIDQEVEVTYVERKLAGVWSRIFVIKIKSLR